MKDKYCESVKRCIKEYLKHGISQACLFTISVFISMSIAGCQNSRQNSQPAEEIYIPSVLEGKPSPVSSGTDTNQNVSQKENDPDENSGKKESRENTGKNAGNDTAQNAKNSSETFAETIVQEESEDTEDPGKTYSGYPQEKEEDNAAASAPQQNISASSGKISSDPAEFPKKETEHFILYEEGSVSDDFIKKAERARTKIISFLDMFSPLSRDRKLSIYLADKSRNPLFTRMHSPDTFEDILNNGHFFLYKDSHYEARIAHEIVHYYFGTFFPPETDFNYWLHEGMAIYAQIELYGMQSTPQWFPETLKLVKSGDGYPLEILTTVDDLEGAKTESIHIWYAQAYSFTKYLINLKGKKSFHAFCERIKNGYSLEQSIYMTYFKTFPEIEKMWHKELFYSK